MTIITWNCNGAFRKKYHLFDTINPDILIIQECENPEKSTNDYKEWANNKYLWIGNNKNKGLAIFVKNNFTIELLDWTDINTNYKNEQLESILPCKINNSLVLLGVWTKKANSDVFGYIGQFWKYLQLHKNKIKNNNILIAGDFNSNSIWDKWDRWWNHSDVVNELEEIGIKSIYHVLNKEKQGNEKTATFYLQRNINKPYHIDYIFSSKEFLNSSTKLEIGKIDNWLEFSDHLPLILKI